MLTKLSSFVYNKAENLKANQRDRTLFYWQMESFVPRKQEQSLSFKVIILAGDAVWVGREENQRQESV